MSSVKNGKKKDIKIILLGILVGLVVCGAGIYGVVSSRIASHEYKNSTDIREVSAVVGYCREVVNKDKDEDGYHRERELREYRVKVTFEIDGETYQDRDIRIWSLVNRAAGTSYHLLNILGILWIQLLKLFQINILFI